MKRLSRRERKAYEEGRAAGYAEGYKNGLHDGNPFNAIIDAVASLAEVYKETAELIKDNPDLLAELANPDNLNTLEIEGGDNDTEGGGTIE